MSLLKLIEEDSKIAFKKAFKESMREKVKNAIKLHEAEFASTLLKDPEDEEQDVEIVVDGQELNPETSQPIEDVDMKDDLLGSENLKEAEFAGWIAFYKGKKVEIKKDEADGIWEAKKLAAQRLGAKNVSDVAIESAVDESTEAEKEFALRNTEAGNGDASADESCNKLTEVAPPGPEAEKFINDNKEEFKARYGDGWEGVLYATAWDKYGKKESSVNEEENPWKVINKETKKTVKSFKSAGEAEKFISNTKDGNKKYYKDYKKPNGKMIGEAKKAK